MVDLLHSRTKNFYFQKIHYSKETRSKMAKNLLRGSLISADFTWFQDRFQAGIQIITDSQGKITEIGPDLRKKVPELPEICLENQAILPGFVNTHSHAFHRGLRTPKMTENSAKLAENTGNFAKSSENFWSWRESMYSLVTESSEQEFYEVCRRAFEEMLRAGITTVGEFHYWHHAKALEECPDPYSMDRLILSAAQDAGIRICLLEAFYERPGIKEGWKFAKTENLAPAQKHFISESLEKFWENFNQIEKSVKHNDMQSLGVVAHSLRAVSPEKIKLLHAEASRRNLPFHMHLEEQPKEIQESEEVYGKSPIALLADSLELSDSFTAVHCTHTVKLNMAKLLEAYVNISVCPLTEGNLGDGIIRFPDSCNHEKMRICFGSDCNNRICFLEEMRSFLYSNQMVSNQRGFNFGVPPSECAEFLLKCATVNGAKSLGLANDCGALEKGKFLDCFTVDLTSDSLLGWNPQNLLDAIILGSSSEGIIASTCVGGMQKIWKHLENKQPNTHFNASATSGSGKITSQDASSVLQFAQSLMLTESISGNEKAIGEELADWLKSMGWHVTKQLISEPVSPATSTCNILASRRPFFVGDKGPKILLNSHIDVVPPYIPPRLSEDGKILYGRGSCDAKGVLASQIFAAMDCLSENPDWDIGLLYLVEEETSHRGAIKVNELNLRPEAVICGEPTEMKMSRGQKGFLKVKLRASGKAAHSGYPYMGESAIHSLLDVLELIRRESWPNDKVLGQSTVNIGLIKGGQAANALAESAEAVVAIRVVSDPYAVLQKILAMVGERKITVDTLSCSSPNTLSVIDGFETAVGAFNTDLPFMNFESNPKRYLFGPGSITVAHGPNEFILVEDLKEGVRMYKKLIECVAKKTGAM